MGRSAVYADRGNSQTHPRRLIQSPQLYAKLLSRKPKPPRNSPPAGASRAEGSPVELRIIGGSMRGRKLVYSGDPLTRPMKDRVREAVFNLIGTAVAGKHALDLFAGTGALALEALSRGAVGATMLERHFPTAELIRRNCDALAVGDRTQVVPVNAFIWVRRELGGAGGHRTDVTWQQQVGDVPWAVFISPPYDFYLDRADEMQSLIATVMDTAPPHSVVLVEADTRFDPNTLPHAEIWDVRAYPPAVVAVWRKNVVAAGDANTSPPTES